MHLALILALLLGLRPDWRPDHCDHVFSSQENEDYCKRQQERGEAIASELAGYMAEETDRFSLPPELLPLVAFREFSLSTSQDCLLTLDATKVTSRELLDEVVDRWKFCWEYRGGINCQPVILLYDDETTGRVRVDRCAYGEVGLFQVRSHEIPAGYELPWGEVLEQRLARRRAQAWDWRTNVHLGAKALAEARTLCCEGDAECQADWRRWVMAYNTGSCRVNRGAHYIRNLERHWEGAQPYVCSQLPDHPLCSPSS